MAPVDPKRLKIRDRVKAVLEAITAGDDYFFTPVKVLLISVLEVDCPGFPCYSVHPDSGGQIAENSDSNYDESFFLNVQGQVKDLADPGAAALKASRDIRRAINEDSKGLVAGSLGTLAIRVRFPEPPKTDNGFFSGQGLAYFEQRVEITTTGDYGDL